MFKRISTDWKILEENNEKTMKTRKQCSVQSGSESLNKDATLVVKKAYTNNALKNSLMYIISLWKDNGKIFKY